MLQATVLTTRQQMIVSRYARRYPHLATLAQNASRMPQVAKALGDVMARLQIPEGVAGADLEALSTIGIKREATHK